LVSRQLNPSKAAFAWCHEKGLSGAWEMWTDRMGSAVPCLIFIPQAGSTVPFDQQVLFPASLGDNGAERLLSWCSLPYLLLI
jgi:hypothetical protein